MTTKKPEKKITPIEVSFKDVFVCQKNSLRPFIEIFIQKPQNIYEENLGTLAGILEVDDQSEESSYVVNYLISVLKKEFYGRTKRGPIESFEAALHKANLALAKLAEHASIGWVGKINAAIIAIEKNNIYLSQAGNAKVLLLRNNQLTDLAEEPEEDIPNPLKTFVDVVSGRLESNDKIVMTSRHIFEIFSLEEIKRSALKFSTEEFMQFLKTALGNELDCAAVIYLEAFEKIIQEMETAPAKKYDKLNVFSQAAFNKKPSPAKVDHKKDQGENEEIAILKEIKQDIEKIKGNFIDKKTGHIYIKEDSFLKEDESPLENLRLLSEEKFSAIKKMVKERAAALKSVKTRPEDEMERSEPDDAVEEFFRRTGPDEKGGRSAKIEVKDEKISGRLMADVVAFLKGSIPVIKNMLVTATDAACSLAGFCGEKLKVIFAARPDGSGDRNMPRMEQKSWMPKISRLKNIYLDLSPKQKIYSGAIILALIVIPYFLAGFGDKPEETAFQETPPVPAPAALALGGDKNVVRNFEVTRQNFDEKIISVASSEGKIFLLFAKGVIDSETKEKFFWPEDFGELKAAAGMEELNLIFLLSQNDKMLAWSPITRQFQANDLTLPSNANASDIGTYLSYLYVLDDKNGQIYRFPRAAGGFGEKSDWIKETAEIPAVADLAVSDSIFLSSENGVMKLFRGKKEPFALEDSATSIRPHKVFAQPESSNIYFLDIINSRLVKTDLDGRIIAQFYHPEIALATDFSIDEKNSRAYLASDTDLLAFPIN